MSRSDNLSELRRMADRLKPAAIEAVRAGQAVIESGMQQRCPVGATHALARSIHSTAVRAGKTSAGGGVVVGTGHAIPIEYGTRLMRAHPFVRPTRDADGPKAEAEMAKVMERGIARG